MPCGGIVPVQGSWIEDSINAALGAPTDPESSDCFLCGKPITADMHFCEEWDALLHMECVEPFLKTDEGKVVIAHGHPVVVRKDCDAG